MQLGVQLQEESVVSSLRMLRSLVLEYLREQWTDSSDAFKERAETRQQQRCDVNTASIMEETRRERLHAIYTILHSQAGCHTLRRRCG